MCKVAEAAAIHNIVNGYGVIRDCRRVSLRALKEFIVLQSPVK